MITVTVRLGDKTIAFEIESGRRAQVLKKDWKVKVFADRRAGKKGCDIYNEVLQQAADEFGGRIFCSVYDGYAILWARNGLCPVYYGIQ